MKTFVQLTAVLFTSLTLLPLAAATEPITLLGTIVKWQYPGSEILPAQMSDAATMDAEGRRTMPSTLMETTMTTPDSVEDVMAFYHKLLDRDSSDAKQLTLDPGVGCSIVFSDESVGRPFAFHLILVNIKNSSTTLVITRGTDEEQTRITWKQYLAHDVAK